MNYLNLNNAAFLSVLYDFKHWLKTVGYAETSTQNIPKHVQEFFYFLELKETVFLQRITSETITEYITYISTRPKYNGDGGLTSSTIHTKIKALKCFSEYLWQKHNFSLPVLIKYESSVNEREILSIKEMASLYNVTECQRDRAILSVYYGCGLRLSEGVALTVQDVQFEKKRLYVAKGKGAKERFVPMSKHVMRDLEDYMYDKRIDQLKGNTINKLFMGRGGQPIKGPRIAQRFGQLLNKAGLAREGLSLHSLRHSIATHLLYEGMSLEDVSMFLGHSSLETTQVYTHLVREPDDI